MTLPALTRATATAMPCGLIGLTLAAAARPAAAGSVSIFHTTRV